MGFADRMQECFEGVGLDMKFSLNKCHKAYSDLSAKIDEKFKENERPAPRYGSNVPSKPNHVPEDAQKKVNKEEVSPVYEERDVSKEKKKKVVVRKSRRPKLTWVGTSISNALDKEKLEKDLNVDLTVVKAYCIEEEGRYKKKNFKAIVPEIVENEDVDTLVLQTGSIEITNIDTNKAAMDPNKDLADYQREWFVKVEDDSTNLFNIAEEAIAKNANLNVIIVKRLPRYDRSSKDIMAIKSKISIFANQVYDQLWLKHGSPARIHLVELPLGCDNSPYLKQMIYGNHGDDKYDGIHLAGRAAVRHFTYRAVQTLLPIINPATQTSKNVTRNFRGNNRAAYRQQQLPAETWEQDYQHTNCEQAQYQRQSASGSHGVRTSNRKYSDVVKNKDNRYSVPTKNFYNPLNC